MQLNRQDQQMKVKLYSIHVPSASKYYQILEIQKSNSLLFSGLKRLRIHKLSININVIKNFSALNYDKIYKYLVGLSVSSK